MRPYTSSALAPAGTYSPLFRSKRRMSRPTFLKKPALVFWPRLPSSSSLASTGGVAKLG
ncbi:Uncharacterised protein [Mycobacterium tuberculosis]|nr:Uncharacterised protein [Mycobacterium tuberculosis]